MKSKVLAALVATMAVGATCAFAANPFVDVPSDSWAYKSVVELADAGIIQGVDGQYFQGQRNITRYEAAEMVAKAMAHQDKATVEQRALINKLADEYADELNNLGVRVSALESRVGNVKLSGDARVRFRSQNDGYKYDVEDKGKQDDKSFDSRVRLRATAKVNDNTTVKYGLRQDVEFSNDSAASNGDKLYTDRAEIVTKFGKNFTASVGRTDKYIIGGPRSYGYNYGDIFDRAELQYKNDNFALTTGYGKFKAGDVAGTPDSFKNVKKGDLLNDGTVATKDTVELEKGFAGVKTGYAELEGFFGNGSAAGVYYNSFNGSNEFSEELKDLWGVYASLNLTDKVNLLANYETVKANDKVLGVNGNDDSASAWVGVLTYGKAKASAPHSWDAWVEYLSADKDAYFGSTNSWRFGQMDNINSWGVGFDYTLAKNVTLNLAQSFGTSTKDGDAKDPEEQTLATINFAF